MPKTREIELSIAEVREILLRHEGSITTIANDLGVRSSTVSTVLAERQASKRIEEACRARAEILLKQEKGDAA